MSANGGLLLGLGLLVLGVAWSKRAGASPLAPAPAPGAGTTTKLEQLAARLGGGSRWGAALVRAALADVGKGEHPAGSNRGPFVELLLGRFGFEPPQNYCAAAIAKWIDDAGRELGEAPPVPGSPGAKATMGQLAKVGLWVPAADVRALAASGSALRPPPGSVAVWDRSQPEKPETAWWGHIAIVTDWPELGRFGTIEANRSDVVELFEDRMLAEPRLLGFGVLP